MSFSLNEVGATAKRAARGAGYAWGLAEEASEATRWLCAQGLDGAAQLALLLEQGLAMTLDDHKTVTLKRPAFNLKHPISLFAFDQRERQRPSDSCSRPGALNSEWAGNGVLCPLITGALLSDRSDMLQDGPISIQNLAAPALLLPFAACAARSQKSVVTLATGAVSAATDGLQLAIEQEWPANVDHIEITLGGILTNPFQGATRAFPDAESWKTLNRFAHQTYAPATEDSRLLGAGADLSDND